MVAFISILFLFAATVTASDFPKPRATFNVNATSYIDELLSAALAVGKNGSVGVSIKDYVVEFEHKNISYILDLDNMGLTGSFPEASVHGDVIWWGNSSIFHVYAEAIIGTHTTYYSGEAGTVDNFVPCVVNLTKTNYVMSTYKKFVYNGTSYELEVHILDAKNYGKHHYNVSIPQGDKELISLVKRTISHVDLKAVRDYTLTALTTFVLSIMDQVDINKYVTNI